MAQLISHLRSGDSTLALFTDLTNRQLRRSLEAEHGILIAESALVVEKALDVGLRPVALLVARRRLDALAHIIERMPEHTPVYALEDDAVKAITGYRVHRGVLGAFARPAPRDPKDVVCHAERLCILEASVDATNVGAIFRSAAALGADGALIDPTCADPLERRCLRTSMGCVLELPWARLAHWPEPAISELRDAGFTVASCALSPDALELGAFAARRRSEEAPGKLALVFGTEGEGLAPATIAASDVVLRIPMARTVDSLNVASAASIFFWELFRSAP